MHLQADGLKGRLSVGAETANKAPEDLARQAQMARRTYVFAPVGHEGRLLREVGKELPQRTSEGRYKQGNEV